MMCFLKDLPFKDWKHHKYVLKYKFNDNFEIAKKLCLKKIKMWMNRFNNANLFCSCFVIFFVFYWRWLKVERVSFNTISFSFLLLSISVFSTDKWYTRSIGTIITNNTPIPLFIYEQIVVNGWKKCSTIVKNVF